MAQKRPTVLIALADRLRAEQLAAWLSEYEGMLPLLRDEIGTARLADIGLDAVVADAVPAAASIAAAPVVLLGDGAPYATDGGVRASLPASAPGSLVAAAIRLAAAGYRVVPEPARAARPWSLGEHAEAAARPVQLTQREREVLALLAEGASNKVIARRLDISVHTAKFHVAAILEKLDAVNRTDAIATAMRDGLVLI